MSAEDRFIDLNELTAFLGVCRASIYVWTRAGSFPMPKKFGKASRWNFSEVQAWVDAQPKGINNEHRLQDGVTTDASMKATQATQKAPPAQGASNAASKDWATLRQKKSRLQGAAFIERR